MNLVRLENGNQGKTVPFNNKVMGTESESTLSRKQARPCFFDGRPSRVGTTLGTSKNYMTIVVMEDKAPTLESIVKRRPIKV